MFHVFLITSDSVPTILSVPIATYAGDALPTELPKELINHACVQLAEMNGQEATYTVDVVAQMSVQQILRVIYDEFYCRGLDTFAFVPDDKQLLESIDKAGQSLLETMGDLDCDVAIASLADAFSNIVKAASMAELKLPEEED